MTKKQRIMYAIVTPFVRFFVYVLGKFGKVVANKPDYQTVFDAETARVLSDSVDIEPYFILDHALSTAERWRFSFPFYGYRRVDVKNSTASVDTRKGWNLGEDAPLQYVGETHTAIPTGRPR